jgi:hypothetical protein
MRQCFLVIGALLLLTGPLWAAETGVPSLKVAQEGTPGRAELQFSTKLGAEFAWQLNFNGTEWIMSFPDDATVVDTSSPTDTVLEDDFVQLPTMRLTQVQDKGGFLTATLTPTEALNIESFPGAANVLRASVGIGNSLVIGTTHVAYSQPQNDLTIISANQNYGTVIPLIAADSARGLQVDMSFTGDAEGGVDLYKLILNNRGSARGTLSGQITAVPEPATFVVLGLGAVLLSRLRSRRLG